MRTMGVIGAVLLAVAVGSSAASGRSTKPALRLTAMQPLAVHGLNFAPRKRVRVVLSSPTTEKRVVKANRRGAFTVEFDEVTVTRCDLVRVVATGAGGRTASLKQLPSPACQID